MTTFLINLGVFAASFAAMEAIAWFTHKFIMHGILWTLHRDHHHKDHGSIFERNDLFFLVFATPGFLLILFGSMQGIGDPRIWAGAGIAAYGFTYALVHDIFIHRRLKWFRESRSTYWTAVRRAHKIHHKHLGREHGECFGMLTFPLRYWREAKAINARK